LARYTVPVDLAGERADKIVAVLGGVSRAGARRLVDDGAVMVEGTPVTARERLAAGTVLVFGAPPRPEGLMPEPVEFTVRYEDAHLAVVDKPAGIVTHPGSARRGGSLAAGLLHRYPRIVGVGEEGRWGIVHRLDRDTSGLLVIALTAETYDALAAAMAERRIHRRYLALVDGLFDAPRGTIEAPIGSDPARPTRRIVTARGKPARTHYRRLDTWGDTRVSLLGVELETGRTHQIRVHLASIDRPVIGDRWYGRPARIDAPRVFLHAARLEFVHPVTGENIEVESPLPADLQTVLDGLGPPERQTLDHGS
jgi:23S rRNA pseudouridine1911/1915/1917 synthase